MKKAGLAPLVLRIVEEEEKRIPSKGWAEMIRKVYEVDPMVCPKCGGTMKVVAFITDYAAVDSIIDHLSLTFGEAAAVTRHRAGRFVTGRAAGGVFLRSGDFIRGRGLASSGRFSGRPER
jgi:hypothetical protein